LVSGSLATTFTASQGLLLFIPNLYKIAGELLPTVIHVAARALAGQALSIYGDHSDVMLARGTGVAMVSSFTVQEAHDMAIICQIVTLNSRVPFLHFMDGFRTSHEINRIQLVGDEDLRELMPWEKVEEHRQRALSPMHPSQRGTAQSPDVFMQLVEASNKHYQAVNSIFEKALIDFAHVTGRKYRPFEYHYYGSAVPSIAIVTMGSSVEVVNETIKYLHCEEVCVIGIRLFRPWSPIDFCNVLPPSVLRVATLDRTKESGAQGEPIYLDVCASLMSCKRGGVYVAGGRYGLASKDFTPTMVKAVIQNLMRDNEEQIQHPFTVGINDDVTHLSLSMGKAVNPLDDGVTECVFWGFGGDGTVGANKESAKIIGDYRQDMSVQAYFEYDAKKSSGYTLSHLRFSRAHNLSAPYKIQDMQADFVACHNETYAEANKFDVLRFVKPGGTFFLNTKIASLSPEKRLKALEEKLSPNILKTLALRKIKFYVTDAGSLARAYGLKGKINMICMAAFFRLAGVIPFDEAMSLLKESISKTYSYRGEDVVRKNHELLDAACSQERLIAIDVPSRWKRARVTEQRRAYLNRHIALIDDDKTRKFMEEIAEPVSHLDGDSIPVSLFLQNAMLGGSMIPGTSKFEKRRPNPSGLVPKWNANDCTQCNQCVAVCPHAVIRPFIVTRGEAEGAPHPDVFTSAKALGAELAGKRYTLQISPLDCTGCNACVEACPESPKALQMQDVEDVLVGGGDENWDYAVNLPERGDLVDKYSLKGSQFQTPLMEFSGACSGCGETPYFKMLTQLFGERMIIANATGCSTIWGGSFPSNPYTVSKKVSPCFLINSVISLLSVFILTLAGNRAVEGLPGQTHSSRTMPSTVWACSAR
jgi:pyruvate-ferredoxin/flavodoxin oxidoreductase